MSKDDGATKVQESLEDIAKRAECQGLRRHYNHWIWLRGEWTWRVRCSTCGVEQDRIPLKLKPQ